MISGDEQVVYLTDSMTDILLHAFFTYGVSKIHHDDLVHGQSIGSHTLLSKGGGTLEHGTEGEGDLLLFCAAINACSARLHRRK